MRHIVAATAIALVAGITLGFVISRGLDGSASAAPPTQAVEEQNLDGSGSIAVHEQGVADVNVVSLPSQPGRVIELGTMLASIGSPALFPFVDVKDCAQIMPMARTIAGSGISIEPAVNTSPDGTTAIVSAAPVTDSASGDLGGALTASARILVSHPFVQIIVAVGGSDVDVTAWIWCAP